MTKKELKQKTTDELQSLEEFNKNKAIELINMGLYTMAIRHLDRAEDIDCILEGRKNGWEI